MKRGILAKHNLGSPELLDKEFAKVNPDFTTRRNWAMILWGATGFFLLQSLFIELPLYFGYISLPNALPHFNIRSNENTFYIISAAVFLLYLFLAFNGYRFAFWFNSFTSKNKTFFIAVAFVLGLLFTYLTFLVFKNAFGGFRLENENIVKSFTTLIFVFYIPLVILTSFITLRNSISEERTFPIFSQKINVVQSLLFGFMAQMLVQFSLSYSNNYLHIFTAILLFGLIGWVISNSKKMFSNLIAVQIIPLAMLIVVWSTNPGARFGFFMEYTCSFVALAVCCAIGKYKLVSVKRSFSERP
jgi:hypothetical protein